MIKRKQVILTEKCYLDEIEEINKKLANVLCRLATMYEEENEFEKAGEYYLLAMEKCYNKTSSDVTSGKKILYNLLRMYAYQNKGGMIESYISLIIENNDINVFNSIGEIFFLQDNYTLTEKYYLLAFENGCDEYVHNLANVYKYLGQLDKAEKYYLLACEDGHDEYLHNLANIYKCMGQLDKAEKYYLLAIGAGGWGEHDCLKSLADIYSDQQKGELAAKYYLLASKNKVTYAAQNNARYSVLP